jgi:hypothetical protein
MNAKDKYLYHQIHPLKLLTDISSGFICLYPLWQHQLVLALLIMLIPAPVASALVMRYANLEPYKQSAVGKYISKYMTHTMEAIRGLGMIAMAFGAWWHAVWLILVGAAVIILAWLNGFFRRTTDRSSESTG